MTDAQEKSFLCQSCQDFGYVSGYHPTEAADCPACSGDTAVRALRDLSGFWLGDTNSRALFAQDNEDTIRRALRLLAAVEAGEWKVVPKIANKIMVDAAIPEYKHAEIFRDGACPFAVDVYNAMLQAAPDFFAGEKEG